MSSTEYIPLLPDLQTVEALFPGCYCLRRGGERTFRGLRLYRPGSTPDEKYLYLIRSGDGFPVDEFCWISTEPLEGKADHICAPMNSREEILDTAAALFARLQEQEQSLNALLLSNANLQDLCNLAADFLENPVYIHDDWFVMEAKSNQVDELFQPEYVMTSGKGFIPRAILEDFDEDSDYLETYRFTSAQLWNGSVGKPGCLYVNLWDGPVFRGRMLAVATNHPIRHSDYRLAEVLAQAALLIHRRQLGKQRNRSMDDVMFGILQGKVPDASDMTQLMNMLRWDKADLLLCIRLQSQSPDVPAIREHALHNELFHQFPGSYIMLTDNQQCLVVNLDRSKMTVTEIRHILAPLCRDYCLYIGISSPVSGIRDLHYGYYQAEIALERAFRVRDEKWIVRFSECAVDYMLEHLSSELQPIHLAAPDLYRLQEIDRRKGTDYYITLREYLRLERDIPKASDKLIIHRTTLLYRLKKIASLICADLEDPNQRLYLLLSYYILEREQIQREEPDKNGAI